MTAGCNGQVTEMISVNEPLLGQRESEYVTDCIRTGWISSAGRYIKEFENEWASYCGRRYGIGVSNGTAALQTAVACLGLKPGDVYWMYAVVLSEKAGMDTPAFAQRLKQRGIETRPFFLGLHEQPAFHQKGLFLGERHPVAERIARQGLYLPSGLALTAEQIARVCDAVHEVLS